MILSERGVSVFAALDLAKAMTQRRPDDFEVVLNDE